MAHELRAEEIIRVFNEYEVQYVLIGAYAAIVQQVPIPATQDVDFFPAKNRENLERLARALTSLGAGLRINAEVDAIPFDPSPQLLEKMAMLNLRCAYGDFDLAFQPAGMTSYNEIARRSLRFRILDVEVNVASVEDVANSKRLAGREKDRRVLPIFEKFLRERERRRGPEIGR